MMQHERNFPYFLKIATLSSTYKTVPEVIHANGNETKYIRDAPLIRLLSEILDFKFDLIEPEDGLFGDSLSDGNWTGILGLVQRDEADLGIGSLSLSERRFLSFNFSHPYNFDAITFITDKPGYVPDKYAMLRPFSPSVWIAVATTLVFVQCISYIFKINDPLLNMSLKIYGSLLEMSVNLRLHRLSTNFLVFTWIIGAMFVSQFYKTNLLSFLTFPTLTGIQNIEQLSKACEDTSFTCSTYDHTNIYNEILNAGGESWQKIGKCLSRNNLNTDNLEAFLRSFPSQKAYIGKRIHLNILRRDYFISDDAFYTDFNMIAIGKSFCCKEELNKVILNFAAAGILKKFVREDEFFLALSRNEQDSEEYGKERDLSLEELSGAFIILAFGHVLATTVFVVEILVTRRLNLQFLK